MKAHGLRSLFWVAAATGAALLVIAAVVFGLGDRSVLVPAPEIVAEGLLRQLKTGRHEQIQQYISDPARATLTPQRLREWFDDLERRIGRVQEIQGEYAVSRGDGADAVVRITGELRGVTVRLPVIRQYGQWAIDGLPETLESTPPSIKNERCASPAPLEELHGTLMALRRRARLERAEVPTSSGFRIRLPRVESIRPSR
jgi:hypothetical protein